MPSEAVALPKDFLSIPDLTGPDFDRLLTLAAELKASRRLGAQAPTASALAGQHVGLLFEKPSLRTRTTFEIAIRELGAHPLDVPAEFAGGLVDIQTLRFPEELTIQLGVGVEYNDQATSEVFLANPDRSMDFLGRTSDGLPNVNMKRT